MPSKTELAALISAALVKAGCVGRDGKTLSTYRAWKLTGINSRDIGQLVAGTRSPSVETLERLFGAVGWEVAVSFYPRRRT